MAFYANYGGDYVAKSAIIPVLAARGITRSLIRDPHCIIQWSPASSICWERWSAGFTAEKALDTGADTSCPPSAGRPLFVSAYRVRSALCRKDLLHGVLEDIREQCMPRCHKGEEAEAALVGCHAYIPTVTLKGKLCISCQCTRVRSKVGKAELVVIKEPTTNNALGVHVIRAAELETELAAVWRNLGKCAPATCLHCDTHKLDNVVDVLNPTEMVVCKDDAEECGEDAVQHDVDLVVQQYVDNIITCGGYKCHLRVNVLAVGNCDVFVHPEIVCHVACEPLHGSSDAVTPEMFRYQHVTNHCVQRNHPKYNRETHTITLQALSNRVCPADKSADWADVVQRRVNCLVAQLFQQVVKCRKVRNYAFLPSRNAFDIFGLDIVLISSEEDEFPLPVLIEVNAGPALEGVADPDMCRRVVDDITAVAIDPLLGLPSLRSTPFTHVFSRDAQDLEAGDDHPWYTASLLGHAARALAACAESDGED